MVFPASSTKPTLLDPMLAKASSAMVMFPMLITRSDSRTQFAKACDSRFVSAVGSVTVVRLEHPLKAPTLIDSYWSSINDRDSSVDHPINVSLSTYPCEVQYPLPFDRLVHPLKHSSPIVINEGRFVIE